MTADKKHELEDHIDLLRELDNHRVESAKLRDEGIKALPKLFNEILQNKSEFKTNEIEGLLYLLRTLQIKPDIYPEFLEDPCKTFLDYCDDLNLNTIKQHDIPVWIASNLLHTLVSIPKGAFHKTTFYCYYWIIRELYTAESAEWSIGGFRASHKGHVTAYMTSECVTALIALADAHKNTSIYISAVGDFIKRNEQLKSFEKKCLCLNNETLKKWIQTERERTKYSFKLILKRYSNHLTLNLPTFLIEDDTDFEKYKKEFESTICSCRDTIREVLENIYEYRKTTDEEKKLIRSLKHQQNMIVDNCSELDLCKLNINANLFNKVIRSHQGHHIATNSIIEALTQSLKGLKYSSENSEKYFTSISSVFNEISVRIHDSLIPAQNFLSTIIDHELTPDSDLHFGQPEELTWAALSYGRISDNWEADHRLMLATEQLINKISDHGVFPNRKYFHAFQGKGTIHTEASYVINAFAQLLKNVQRVEITADISNKLLRFFKDTQVINRFENKLNGWRTDISLGHHKSDPLATTQAILALHEINTMLDERINQLILKHFSVKWPDRELNGVPALSNLFYPDYGLLLMDKIKIKNLNKDNEKAPKLKRTESIAITLLRLQAHINQQNISDKDPLNSIILYGPAGTGKTFLIESLAKTGNVPLIEVTPSDIVKQGIDNVERRARTVFEALSFLTRAVILFDEFDPVLKRRDPDNQKPTVFSFLTPGMLPKLKTLHGNAEKRSVGYVLITNLIGSLDEAAIRKGRFDKKIGVYPPDLLSRVGRLLDQLFQSIDKLNDNQWKRFVEVIQQSSGKGMTSLGKPGVFTHTETIKPHMPMHYIENGPEGSLTDFDEPEQTLKPLKEETYPAELKEYCEWAWIEQWDKKINNLAPNENESFDHICKSLKNKTKKIKVNREPSQTEHTA